PFVRLEIFAEIDFPSRVHALLAFGHERRETLAAALRERRDGFITALLRHREVFEGKRAGRGIVRFRDRLTGKKQDRKNGQENEGTHDIPPRQSRTCSS